MKLDKAFPQTPKAFENALYEGIKEGERRQKMKYKLRITAIAACLIVCLLAIAFATGTGNRTDTTSTSAPEGNGTGIGNSDETTHAFVGVSPTPTPDPAPQPERYYATQNGRFYHNDPNCQGMANASLMTLDMLEALQKLPCPVCLADKSIDLSDYRQQALDTLNHIFPGCTEVLEKHYNVDQLYTDPWTDNGTVHVKVEANSVTVARVDFDGGETHVALYFNDVEICKKILTCRQADTLSDKLSELYIHCKEELLVSILAAIHNTVYSHMPVSSEYYSLRMINLSFFDELEECTSAVFTFASQYYCEASFTFDLAEGDALSNVTLSSQ